MARRARVLVRGLVQGIFYRQSCAAEAERLRVNGFVRNLSDGRVEAVFEGEDQAVEEMIDWCREGPPAARVDEVEVEEEELAGESFFEVQR